MCTYANLVALVNSSVVVGNLSCVACIDHSASSSPCPAPFFHAPKPLAAVPWRTEAELLDVVTRHYRALDANMSRANLQEVSERITAAMPSAHLRHKATLLGSSTSVPPSPAKHAAVPNSGGDAGAWA